MKTFVGEYLSEVPTQSEAGKAVRGSIAGLPRGRWLLAVSGGRDSMVLLHAAASERRDDIAAVATFDHGSGRAATRAAMLVERTALRLGIPAVSGALPAGASENEATWREARWRFLNGWAAEFGARVVTAHSWDDQVETVVLRILRDAGARGLAGMLAESEVLRPFIKTARARIAEYAAECDVRFVDDPSNASPRFARNRVRNEILPALERASPGFGAWAYALSVRAAALRASLREWVDRELTPTASAVAGSDAGDAAIGARGTSIGVRAAPLASLDPAGAALVWPEVAVRVGVAMDRRGIARVVAWAPHAVSGGRIQLSGGAEILRTRSAFVLRSVY